MNTPTYPPVKKPEEQTTVEKSIAKPHAFAKAGSDKPSRTMRFRPMKATRPPGRPRTRKRDPRQVKFY